MRVLKAWVRVVAVPIFGTCVCFPGVNVLLGPLLHFLHRRELWLRTGGKHEAVERDSLSSNEEEKCPIANENARQAARGMRPIS